MAELIEAMEMETVNVKRFAFASLIPWLICGLGALFYSYEYFLRITPSVMTHELMDYYAIGAASFGNLVAFYYYIYTPMQIPVGLLMDRFGPRRLLTLACALCGLGVLLFANGQYYSVAAMGRLLVGFGSAFAFIGTLKLATIWLPPNRFALIAGVTTAIGTLGGITGDLILTHLVNHIGWYSALWYSGVIAFGLSVVLWVFLRDSVSRPTTTAVESTTKSLDFLGLVRGCLKILANRQIWLNGLVGGLLYLPTSVFAELWGIPYLQADYGFSNMEAAYAVSFLFLGVTVGSPISGWISDKMNRRLLPLTLGGLMAMLVLLAILFVPHLSRVSVFGLLFILGMFYSVQSIVFAISRELCPENLSGTALAIANALVMLGGVLFQPFVGWVMDIHHGSFAIGESHHYAASDYTTALMLIPAGLFLSVIITTFFMKEPVKTHNH